MKKISDSIFEGMKKAAIAKEAIASVELDKGQTQTFIEEDLTTNTKKLKGGKK